MRFDHERLTRTLADSLSIFGGFLIFVSALLVFLDVTVRKLFSMSVFESFELTRYAFAIAIAFGLSSTIVYKSNIRIDVVYNYFPVILRRIVDMASLLSLLFLTSLMAYYAWDLAFENHVRGSRSATGLRVKLGYPQLTWASGLILLWAVNLYFVVRSIWAALRLQFDKYDQLTSIDMYHDNKESEK